MMNTSQNFLDVIPERANEGGSFHKIVVYPLQSIVVLSELTTVNTKTIINKNKKNKNKIKEYHLHILYSRL